MLQKEKDVITEVLYAVRENVDSEAIVAGGCPRNHDEGKGCNDVDLYLRSYKKITSPRWKASLAMMLCVSEDALESYQDAECHYESSLGIEIKNVIGVVYKGIQFQFIFLKPDQEYFPSFCECVVGHMDIGLNRVWYDIYSLKSGLYLNKTKEYVKDREERQLTLYTACMGDTQLSHCMNKHLPKMMNYYPDYSLTVNTTKKGTSLKNIPF